MILSLLLLINLNAFAQHPPTVEEIDAERTATVAQIDAERRTEELAELREQIALLEGTRIPELERLVEQHEGLCQTAIDEYDNSVRESTLAQRRLDAPDGGGDSADAYQGSVDWHSQNMNRQVTAATSAGSQYQDAAQQLAQAREQLEAAKARQREMLASSSTRYPGMAPGLLAEERRARQVDTSLMFGPGHTPSEKDLITVTFPTDFNKCPQWPEIAPSETASAP